MKVHVFTPNIVTGITIIGFEVGKNLARSRSNFLLTADNAPL